MVDSPVSRLTFTQHDEWCGILSTLVPQGVATPPYLSRLAQLLTNRRPCHSPESRLARATEPAIKTKCPPPLCHSAGLFIFHHPYSIALGGVSLPLFRSLSNWGNTSYILSLGPPLLVFSLCRFFSHAPPLGCSLFVHSPPPSCVFLVAHQ